MIAGALDQHLYAWRGNGNLMPGFPRKLQSAGADGAEIVTTPAIAELDGRDCDATGAGQEGPRDRDLDQRGDRRRPARVLPADLRALQHAARRRRRARTRSTRSTPTAPTSPAGRSRSASRPATCCRSSCPGHDSAILDEDANPDDDEVSVSAATSIVPGGSRLVDGNGAGIREYQAAPGNLRDTGPVLSLADYSSVGDVLGQGQPAVLKGGLTLNGAANLLAVNQNLPFNHAQLAWDPSTGTALPGYPIATDDFQLLGQASVARVGGRARAPDAGRHGPLQPPRLRPDGDRARRLAEVHRRLAAGDPRGRRRRRRRRPRRHHGHARGLVVPLGHGGDARRRRRGGRVRRLRTRSGGRSTTTSTRPTTIAATAARPTGPRTCSWSADPATASTSRSRPPATTGPAARPTSSA